MRIAEKNVCQRQISFKKLKHENVIYLERYSESYNSYITKLSFCLLEVKEMTYMTSKVERFIFGFGLLNSN